MSKPAVSPFPPQNISSSPACVVPHRPAVSWRKLRRPAVPAARAALAALFATVTMTFGAATGAYTTAYAASKHSVSSTGSVTRYASTAGLVRSGNGNGNSILDSSPASATLKSGLKALRKGDMAKALANRRALPSGSLERKVLAWAIAMNGKNVDVTTLHKISNDLSHWPGTKAMRISVERALVSAKDKRALRIAFTATQPESQQAKIALAKAQMAAGKKKAARKTIAPIWHRSVLERADENRILKQFGSVLTKADHRSRLEYLLAKRRINAAQRIAGLAGATRLVKARAAVERKQKKASKHLAAVPASQRSDPNYLYTKALHLRRADKLRAAAKVLISAKPKRIHPNFADQFFREKRILASDLLEAGNAKTAYKLVSGNVARSKTRRIDAEFYAGWIALRRLKDKDGAARHFRTLLDVASTPLSRSRGYYWLARASRDPIKRKANFQAAAQYDTTYYGQLAAVKLGRDAISVSRARPTRTTRARFPQFELVQAIAKLESAGQKRLARPIYRFLARRMTNSGELALLAARAERSGDHQLALQIGKIGMVRGFDVETLAWPIGAIPRSAKTNTVGLPLAYAIARQESTFRVDARSPANALGLLQLLPSTAKRTARSIGIGYSRNKLVTNASYNVRLGTAYLDKQLDRFNGSYILTFAAYNAGPLRAEQWVERLGDPRGKPLDFVIDWVEQIPYAETRNYVQRVMENYQVYKARLKSKNLTIKRDLRHGRRS